jgi:DNA-binding HxlR family transcriptional regulator
MDAWRMPSTKSTNVTRRSHWPSACSESAGTASTFVALRRAVAGISDTVLSDRLAELTQAGLVDRAVDAGPPVTVSYSLTASGNGLLPILSQLGQWASANLELPAR